MGRRICYHGRVSDPIVVVDYDPAWPALFTALCVPVAAALGALAVAIEHVGSTAVPGLAAKPIVDLDVAIPSAADLPAATVRLAPLSYVHEGEPSSAWDDARCWRRGCWEGELCHGPTNGATLV
jgi:GrpB-like predicted nucleotidyltransferase (UPF0157 family)